MERLPREDGDDERPLVPPFSVFRPDDDEPPTSNEDDQNPLIRISVNMRLPQFYHRWFKPIVIDGEGLSRATELGYEQTLRWWKSLTKDPPLRMIDAFCVSKFASNLRTATYRRGLLGSDRPLSPHRVSIVLRNVRSMLNRVGEQRQPDKETAGLALKVPVVPVDEIEGDPKPAFTLDEARRIAAAASQMDCPAIDGLTPCQFWRGLLGCYYVSGLRRGSLLGCEWSMIRSDGQHHWLTVPGRLVSKTGKSKRIVLPPWLWSELAQWPRERELLFPWPHDINHLNDVHDRLQIIAGIPIEQRLSIQGWRRTHSSAMGDVGLGAAERLSQLSMDHADGATTRRFYVNFENRARLRLPPLWELQVEDPRQGRLF